MQMRVSTTSHRLMIMHLSLTTLFFDWCLHRATCSSWCQLVFSVGQVAWPWSLSRPLQCRWLFLSVFHDGSWCGSWPLAAFFFTNDDKASEPTIVGQRRS